MILALAAALLLQQPDTLPTFDSTDTERLVIRAIQAVGDIPAELRDYEADIQSTMQITIAADTAGVADLPATVDEVVSTLRWERRGYLHQEVIGHRARVLVPLPYTLATLFEQPWVIPHLYGSRIYAPLGGAAAINPFSAGGPAHYRYIARDTVRIRLPEGMLTLVPIEVRPAVDASAADGTLVVGTFDIDVDRAAVARARVGFVGADRILPRTFGQVETFVELENGLWEGRYWLPFRQRRDIYFESRLLGGAVTARVVNRFEDLRVNTGWTPTGDQLRLDWDLIDRGTAFAGWRATVGDEESELSASDFDDLRLVASTTSPTGRAGIGLHVERGNHLFRYNRVEGPFLGIGARVVPGDPRASRWQLYGTGGWAFAENTPRGEITFRQGAALAALPEAGVDWGVDAALYRRLRDIQPFRPTFMWDWFYTLPALLWGSDPRDYYDALGGELSIVARDQRWSGRLTGRVEQHDSLSINTDRFLFGTSTEFGPLAGVEPGLLTAVELGGQYSLGPGAFGIGNSFLTRVEGEAGFGDFGYQRITALLSIRYSVGPLTIAARGDAGHVLGEAPPQKLFRFGSVEGLRGYEPNEFGGSTAVLGRGRLLLGLPPRSSQPLARAGLFLIPPLRPNLVLLGETGRTTIDAELVDELARLGSRTTDGYRSSWGVGLSIFDDAVTVERIFPMDEDRDPRWYVGLTYWY